MFIMNDWCFRPRFCTSKALLGRRQPGHKMFIKHCTEERLLHLLNNSQDRKERISSLYNDYNIQNLHIVHI